MLKQAQIDAETLDPLTDGQILTLTLLVKQYPAYANAPATYPQLEVKLQEEKDTPTVKTQALKAVLTALGKLPNLVVESNGSADAQKFFSSVQNWASLAQDVLNILYDVPIPTGSYRFALAQRKIDNAILHEDVIIRQRKTGRRY